ncbi:hypothetical protein JB92DRAFT_2946977, partial [Gautieria morchelliformis]
MCGHGPIFLHLLLIVLFSGGIFVIFPIIVCLMVLAVTARANDVWGRGPMGLVRIDSVVCRRFLGCGLFLLCAAWAAFLRWLRSFHSFSSASCCPAREMYIVSIMARSRPSEF